MKKLNKFGSLIKRFRTEAEGTIAVIWAFSAMAVVVAAGSAYDFSKVMAARQKSQSIADMIALTAAVYIRDHNGDRPTNSNEGFVNNTEYKLSDLNLVLDPYNSQKRDERGKRQDEPYLKVHYDTPVAGEVTVQVIGLSSPSFMQIVGIDKVDFSAQSTVKYQVDKTDPASIFLVLDNSGSMNESDDDNITRMDELEASVRDFMDELQKVVDENEAEYGSDANRILRTAMIPYYTRVDYNLDVPPKWGVLTDNQINAMYAGGGTNSHPGMKLAREWMEDEQAIHTTESEADSMLPYVILMTDGVNNSSSYDTSTLAECQRMKDNGVKVFTVGYALTTNGAATGSTQQRALNMLQSCASGDNNFFHAESAAALKSIFEGIGQDIVQDQIRIRG